MSSSGFWHPHKNTDHVGVRLAKGARTVSIVLAWCANADGLYIGMLNDNR